MIKVTINGRLIELEKPVKVLEAATLLGIQIPTMCNHPAIEPFGGCRMCLVKVEGMHRLQASCMLDAKDGMVVETETPEIVKARKAMLEFMLINHPLDCPTCDKAGECDLQDFTMLYGAAAGRFSERKRTEPESLRDPLIVRNMERCIMCTKCVRVCAEMQGASAINVIGRGKQTAIEPFSGGTFECEYCGSCIPACPVGSLMSKLHRYSYRPWETENKEDSACPYCGVGCEIRLQVREDHIQRTMPGPSEDMLCARGFFGYEFVSSAKRLTTPLIRKSGKLMPASWDEALDMVAKRLGTIKEAYGGKSIAGIGSARCTVEENYLLQKLLRAGLGSNNIDSIARMGLAGIRLHMEGFIGAAPLATGVDEVRSSDAILVAGSDPTTQNPVLGVRVRNAYMKGAKVITLGHVQGLRRHNTIALGGIGGTEWGTLGCILREIMLQRPMPGARSDFETLIKGLELPPFDSSHCLYNEIESAVSILASSRSITIITGRELAQDPRGARNILILCGLAYMLGARVCLISEGPNENGLLDMGVGPDILPGPVPIDNHAHRNVIEEAWACRLPDSRGFTLMEMVDASYRGDLKALYVMGENPAFNLPDSQRVREALKKLDFLVVQDLFMNETTEFAHVVLPAMSWAERDGFYAGTDRRLRRVRAAVRGKGMEDWRILSEVGRRLGPGMNYTSSNRVLAEIASISTLYANAAQDRFEGNWPYGGKYHPALESIAHPEIYQDLLKDTPMKADGAIRVMIDKPLFLSGTLSRHSDALMSIQSGPKARISPRTAESLFISAGDMVEVSTERGKLVLEASIEPDIPDYAVFLTGNYKNSGIMELFRYNILPFTGAPFMDAPEARISRGT